MKTMIFLFSLIKNNERAPIVKKEIPLMNSLIDAFTFSNKTVQNKPLSSLKRIRRH